MTPMRVPVVGLVGSPGRTRALALTVAPSDVDGGSWGALDDALEDPIRLDLHLDSVVEGLLVRGTVATALTLECARCLTPVRVERDVTVAELFVDPARRDPDDEEPDDPGYELLDDATAIDLSTLVRDALLLELPVRVLCDPACRGLCPTCGADRNLEDCGHTAEPAADDRWAALAALRLPEAAPGPEATADGGPGAPDGPDGSRPAATA